jgi:hypothetical protein
LLVSERDLLCDRPAPLSVAGWAIASAASEAPACKESVDTHAHVRARITFFVTLLIMGLGTVLIGCLPTYEQAGVAGQPAPRQGCTSACNLCTAPVLLVIIRLLQGLAIGGLARRRHSQRAYMHCRVNRRVRRRSCVRGGEQP